MDIDWITVILPAALLFCAFAFGRRAHSVLGAKGIYMNAIAGFLIVFTIFQAGADLMYLAGVREAYQPIPEIYLSAFAAAAAYVIGIKFRFWFRSRGAQAPRDPDHR